ncbi:MAG: hypothetical protein HQL91_02000 [Magnetococcales bacterium]|nr:hypothetical protein [Magnetococcales bacterium]
MLDDDALKLTLFAQESQRRLATSLSDLHALSSADTASRQTILDRLLRTIRGIGGAAPFHNLNRINQLSESIETLLSRLRNRVEWIGPENTAALMAGVRKLHQLLNDLKASESLAIEEELAALQAALLACTTPTTFDLSQYPQAVSLAVSQGLHFFSIALPLSRNPATNRKKFTEVKEQLQVVGTLIASLPELGEDWEWMDDTQAEAMRLLVLTVLQKDLLSGLTQLPPDQIVPLSIPEALQHLVAVPEGPSGTEDPHPFVEEFVADPEPSIQEEPDLLTESQLGDVEYRMRQTHMEEIERQRVQFEEQLRAEQRQAALLANQLQRKRRQSRIGWGVAVGGVTVVAALMLAKGLDDFPFFPKNQKEARVVAPVPPPPVSAPKEPERISAPSKPLPEPVIQPTTTSSVAPVVEPPPPAPPESAEPKEKPAQSASVPDPSAKPDAVTAPAQTPKEETKLPQATPERANQKQPGDLSGPRAFLGQYQDHFQPIVRLVNAPYEKITPAKGTRHGSLAYRRNENRDVVFSIAEMMGHTASRPGDTFKITPESMAELKLVLQLERGSAYLFELDPSGKVVVPSAFFDPFARISKKGVTISRVVEQDAQGVHLRDVTAISMRSIVKAVSTK